MKTDQIVNLSRRRFVAGSAVSLAGLTLGIIPTVAAEQREAGPGIAGQAPETAGDFSPNAFLRIDGDGIVTVISKHLEMGQGTYTGMATLVAEELDADWDQVRVEGAPADAGRYNNLFWGKAQGTGGSTAIANSWKQMRKAGAAARQMLVQAAAKQWQVEAAEIKVKSGVISHPPSGRQAGFGELAELAAKQPVPESVTLKDPKSFSLIGQRVPRKDSPEKINGQAIFTQDVKLPGMLTTVVLHPPRLGATVSKIDAKGALAVKGVREVIQIPSGVAVVADDFWQAKLGRDALSVSWDESKAFNKSSAQILQDYRKLAEKPGLAARTEGDGAAALASADDAIEAEYSVPFLSHSAMEPMNCVVRIDEAGCEVWNGEQMQTSDQHQIAALLGLEPHQVHINMLYAGGSFGRRANPAADYLLETVHIAKALKPGTPLKMVWTREDDTHAGYYRPLYLHRMRAALNDQGEPHVWDQRIVGQSILKGTPFESVMVKDGVDMTSVEGAANLPYEIKHIQVDLHSPELPVPVLWWRAVGSTHTAFAVECFIDELAVKAGQDPLAYRRKLLRNHPRHLGVLNLAAEKAGWGEPMGRNRGQGIAVHESFNSYVAQVVEVSVRRNVISVDRVVIAVDCGVAVNPDVVVAQMEGGMGFGLSAALLSELTFREGRVEQSNFTDYRILRIDQMPEVEVHIVASAEAPTGVGEPATPVIAPAVANAVFAATGQRLRQLPLRLG
ncbi:MAG: xanthine dehydrogenase family protein molybdopterin-binding subunit [Candidatus Thiodiazotropha endolucinida]|nr:xanthine dehydrogenase family protein molybdopterin-binding subunit [Candidatus Thiodiazotropha taylori]MCW4324234.1 xanthine dehydrogenase family protein molybdopterin-binding subunit [Candidatus Thiodiazotropha taylori]